MDMRRRFRLLLFLVIVFSFLIGFPIHTLDLEVTSVARVLNGQSNILDAIKIIVLIAMHLCLLSLLFRDQDRYTYTRYLIWFPVGFLVIHTLNALGFYLSEPRILLTALPFCVAYSLCLFQYRQLLKQKERI
ncbi:hypothetical protein A0256_18405 [Mucilaginibacter sp. PAMC 26640]|nr:hypothetical protein A0256_18405 [Mucilaginibacter sp. PAMC 26640]